MNLGGGEGPGSRKEENINIIFSPFILGCGLACGEIKAALTAVRMITKIVFTRWKI